MMVFVVSLFLNLFYNYLIIFLFLDCCDGSDEWLGKIKCENICKNEE